MAFWQTILSVLTRCRDRAEKLPRLKFDRLRISEELEKQTEQAEKDSLEKVSFITIAYSSIVTTSSSLMSILATTTSC
ncbi:hypothetical protein L218DRAFT_955928, partial [Marasmius fiardii PR-910]